MSQHPTAVQDEARDAANILFRAPSLAPNVDRICANLLAAGDAPPDCTLWITYTRSPDEKLASWHDHGSETVPSRTGVVVVGDRTRTTAAAGSAIPARPASPVVKTVADPTDLTGLGVAVSEFFETWATDDNRLTVCFDSLTPLLAYVSVDRACRFLRTLTTRVDALGATAHYHLDSDAHDARTVSRLGSLFDEDVTLSEN